MWDYSQMKLFQTACGTICFGGGMASGRGSTDLPLGVTCMEKITDHHVFPGIADCRVNFLDSPDNLLLTQGQKWDLPYSGYMKKHFIMV